MNPQDSKNMNPIKVDNIFAQFYQRVINPNNGNNPPAPRPSDTNAKVNADHPEMDMEKMSEDKFQILYVKSFYKMKCYELLNFL